MKKFFIIIFIGILASCSNNSSEQNSTQQENFSINIQNFCNSIKIGSVFDKNFPNFSDFRLTNSQNSEFWKIESYSYWDYSSDICMITVQDSKIVWVNFFK